MITLTSNVRQVRERFERFRSGMKSVSPKSVAPEYWIPLARREAQTVLSVIVPPQMAYLIPQFVQTIIVAAFGSQDNAGMIWTMERVREIAIELSSLTPEQRQHIWERRMEIIDRQTVEEWVAQAKDKTSRDLGQSDEQIADRILAILFGPQDPERENAAWSLLFGSSFTHEHHLLEFQPGLLDKLVAKEDIAVWMRAVLTAWRELILRQLPQVIRQNIRKAWAESAA